MGQIFHAVVYDVEKRECYSEEADKFHANCYSYSGAVCATHYLLRQAPYRVMWSGGYIVLKDAIKNFLSDEKLLGISITEDLEDFQRNNEDLESKPYYEQIKFIEANHKTWKELPIREKAFEYFDFLNTQTVKYSGYLVNHSKKESINLKEYYEKSISLTRGSEEFLIDVIPPLTETGGGTIMALFDGCSADTTEQLIGTWCGDLLQIVDECPDGYNDITCCFAVLWERAFYCKKEFGLDDQQFILKNKNGDRYEATTLSFYQKRGRCCYIKYVQEEDGAFYRPVYPE